MKKTVKFIAVLLGIAVFFTGANFLYQFLSDRYAPENIAVNEEQAKVETETEESTPAEPPKAPNFTVQDADGNAVQLSDFRGKPVVLNFWASWCPPCKGEMPDFEAMYKIYSPDVQFMMVRGGAGSRGKNTGAGAERDQGRPAYRSSAPQAVLRAAV